MNPKKRATIHLYWTRENIIFWGKNIIIGIEFWIEMLLRVGFGCWMSIRSRFRNNVESQGRIPFEIKFEMKVESRVRIRSRVTNQDWEPRLKFNGGSLISCSRLKLGPVFRIVIECQVPNQIKMNFKIEVKFEITYQIGWRGRSPTLTLDLRAYFSPSSGNIRFSTVIPCFTITFNGFHHEPGAGEDMQLPF